MRRESKRRQRILVAETLEIRRCMAASFGWDGPGQGSAELTYYVGTAPSGISQTQFESTIESALDVWSDVIDVSFQQTSRPNQADSLDFNSRFLDGRDGTLAQAYFPDDVNPARIAGDVEFDSSESWEVGNAQGNRAFDLLHVAVHEIGHALGIDHLNDVNSVLAPYVYANQQFTKLTAADVDAALAIYAPARVQPSAPDNPTNEIDNTDLSPTGPESNDEPDDRREEESPRTYPRWRPWRWQWQRFRFWFFWNSSQGSAADSQPSLSINVSPSNERLADGPSIDADAENQSMIPERDDDRLISVGDQVMPYRGVTPTSIHFESTHTDSTGHAFEINIAIDSNTLATAHVNDWTWFYLISR